MRMKVLAAFALAVSAIATLALFVSGRSSFAADAPDGKAIFLAQKCNMCHSVPTAEITKTMKSDKMAAPDLMTGDMDKEKLVKFLKKEVGNNEGKKHGKEWKGTDAELTTLTDWLIQQKKPA
jgi:cytochrome c551/c552